MTHVRRCFRASTLIVLCLLLSVTALWAQSTAGLGGTVTDQNGAAVAGAKVTVTNQATGVAVTTQTNETGAYLVPGLLAGKYDLTVEAAEMQPTRLIGLILNTGKTTLQNVQLKVAQTTQVVTVEAATPMVETRTITVGQTINERTVQEIPLNGRHFVDLGLLLPGSVTPPQNGFLTAPLRGQGSFAFNTAGNREDTVNFMINGVNLNDMVQNQITFQPSISTVQEFTADNSTYSAEYGRNSGAIVNIATRSGTNAFHGELFEYLRNNWLDARNFFNPRFSASTGAPLPQATFKRNQFGADIGGPIIKNKLFFYVSYEGLRQRQGININSGVLSDSERAGVVDPTSLKLLDFIPHANSVDGKGNPIFLGSATAPVNIDQGTADISYVISDKDRLHGYYVFQADLRQEPTLQGNTIPGFGDTRASHRQILTLNEDHVFSPSLVNEVRLGFNRIHITFTPNNLTDPTTLGINDGNAGPAGLPQITINAVGLNFGGPAGFPQGRGDVTGVLSDTLSYLHGNHSFKFGGEFRRFPNDNFNSDAGTVAFTGANRAAIVSNFQNGVIGSFAVTPGSRPSRIGVNALGFFAMDNWKIRPWFTLELGLRFDWNGTPTEAKNRFVEFDPATSTLIQTHGPYQQNFAVEPRLGFAWDLFHDGKTILRAGYGYFLDQPVTNMVTGLASNPPFAIPVNFTGATGWGTLITAAKGSGLGPATVNPGFDNSYTQSWNLNIQREITPTLAIMVGYFGSKATHLRLSRNLNQRNITTGARPFPVLVSDSFVPCPSATLPSCNLGNTAEVDSAGNSNYNALWITANKRFSHGFQFNASYTFSKSLDYNSLSSQGVVIQNSLNPRGDYGLSDFDVRHRFVINWVYDLPFKGNRFKEGWQLASIFQAQGGNPINIVTLASFEGIVGVVRPDLLLPVNTTGNPAQWFSNSTVCSAPAPGCAFLIPTFGGNHFGDLPRNAFTGPGFTDVDFSIAKNTKINERFNLQFRCDAFDLFNHPNFGQPGRIAVPGSTTFGVITSTRFPTGDSGSSRQLQMGLKLTF